MSGAKPLKTVWKERAEKAVGEGGASTTVYVADLAGQGLKSMPGLRVDGQRGVRASFPNRCVLPQPLSGHWQFRTNWAPKASATSL